ncbi:hypothetical protein HanPI659440_Chr08g0311191 [Helianthus annuus]|nr:hypothetical protein HanPI659440_Chr08g0311191 [Helianthus annuus]
MPMLWRVLLVLDRIKNAHIPNLSIHDLPLAYRLRSHGSSRFLFYSTSNDPLILWATRNEEEWKTKFFFVKRSSITGGADYPVKWLRRDASKVSILLDLEELDSYPTPVQVKKETPAVTSSKPAATPKPNPRTRASTSKKRKGSETTAPASEGFSYEMLSFTESLEPMTSFLNKGLQHLLHLYTEACEIVKLQEVRIKQLETTVADQGTIAEAKTRHYEDKLKKVTQDAEVKLASAQLDHDQAMFAFREGVKNSAVVSLLQARIKMAYEAREIGLKCPS